MPPSVIHFLKVFLLFFRITSIGLSGIILGWLLLGNFIQFRMTDEEWNLFFQENNLSGQVAYCRSPGYTMRYVSVGSDTLPLLLMVHGAPSSSSYFRTYLQDDTLRKHYQLVAVDRLGYGYSSRFGTPEISLSKQAEALYCIINKLTARPRPVLVLGTSYGTSVACRLAMDYPKALDGLVLSAPSLAPGQEYTYPISYWVGQPQWRWLLPDLLHLANAEKLSHPAELSAMLPHWHKVRVPVFYIQGTNDQLIYPSNAIFAKRMLGEKLLQVRFLPGRDHFISISEKEEIKKGIFMVYKNLDFSRFL
jgi:pimeloyl-ACP methyl ester carboxylesterase